MIDLEQKQAGIDHWTVSRAKNWHAVQILRAKRTGPA